MRDCDTIQFQGTWQWQYCTSRRDCTACVQFVAHCADIHNRKKCEKIIQLNDHYNYRDALNDHYNYRDALCEKAWEQEVPLASRTIIRNPSLHTVFKQRVNLC